MSALFGLGGLAAQYVQHGLMIAGGALIGALLTAVILVVLFRLVRVKKVPRRLTTLLSIAGGVVGGWLVWALLSAGTGHGPGRGGGIIGGDLTGKGSVPIATSAETRREPADSLRVMIVRSRDYEPESKRYYLVEGRPPARTLPEVIQVIKDRHQLNPALKNVEVVIYQDSIAETRGLADDLEEPVRPLGLTIKTHKPGTDAP